MKIGIVGCSTAAKNHILYANKRKGIDIVGVVDKDIDKAEKISKKLVNSSYFDSLIALLEYTKLDIIHILTPPHTHFLLTKQALNAKCNVFIKTPFAMNYDEVKELYKIADENKVRIFPIYSYKSYSFMHEVQQLIDSGSVGDIVNVEATFTYDSEAESFKKYQAPHVLPWIYTLPGGVFHNYISHPLYLLLPYVGKCLDMQISEDSFGYLPQSISDKITVVIKGELTTANITLAFKPHFNHRSFTIYGNKKTLRINLDDMTLTSSPVSHSSDNNKHTLLNNINKLFNTKFKFLVKHNEKKLLHKLLDDFYNALKSNERDPVSRKYTLHVVEVMDAIWPRIANKYLKFMNVNKNIANNDKSHPYILVTGSTGFLGKSLIKLLLNKGYRVRALVRLLSNIDFLEELDVDIFYGDIANEKSLEPAFQNIDCVIHAAADTIGNKKDGDINTILGVKNIIKLCIKYNINKLIYVSSCNVYSTADYKKGTFLNEESALEKYPDKRGNYTSAKMKAEKLVTDAMTKGEINAVCLRPGTYFGSGGDLYTPMMGMSFSEKVFIIIGNGEFILPLIYIENVSDAIITAINNDCSTGKIYNLTDDDMINKKQYVDQFLVNVYPKAHFIYVPYLLFYTLVYLQEISAKLLNIKPFLTRYRLLSSQNPIIYDSSKIKNELNWVPPYTLHNALEIVSRHEQENN